MKKLNWQITLGAVLIFASALLYSIHYLIFHEAHHIFIYLVGDIAFVPLEVLLVTLFLHRLLEARERKHLLHKLNMVIGAFFSETGTDLLKLLYKFDENSLEYREKLKISPQWADEKFTGILSDLIKIKKTMKTERGNLLELKIFLEQKRAFLLRLLENPNLLEHDTFTDLLWAVFHLTEELTHREDLSNIPETDSHHLNGDIKRAYEALVSEWVDYMHHLKTSYPYLFSLAVRTNPFNPDARITVTE